MTSIQELSQHIKVDPRFIRAYLRRNYPRPEVDKRQYWELSDEVCEVVANYFLKKRGLGIQKHKTTEEELRIRREERERKRQEQIQRELRGEVDIQPGRLLRRR